jgi:hypothetical protein
VASRKEEEGSILGLRRSESEGRLETRLRGVLDDYRDTLRGGGKMRLRGGGGCWSSLARRLMKDCSDSGCFLVRSVDMSASTGSSGAGEMTQSKCNGESRRRLQMRVQVEGG